MNFLLILVLVSSAAVCQASKLPAGKFVWDILKPTLSTGEILNLMNSRDAGRQYPCYNEIPQTSFTCTSKAQAGLYADIETQCQVFHRCDYLGQQTDYICPNETVFNQVLLVCDWWYNVDCIGYQQYENLANSQLYTGEPLFESPSADYVAPSQQQQVQHDIQPRPAQHQSIQSIKPIAKPASGGNIKA